MYNRRNTSGLGRIFTFLRWMTYVVNLKLKLCILVHRTLSILALAPVSAASDKPTPLFLVLVAEVLTVRQFRYAVPVLLNSPPGGFICFSVSVVNQYMINHTTSTSCVSRQFSTTYQQITSITWRDLDQFRTPGLGYTCSS